MLAKLTRTTYERFISNLKGVELSDRKTVLDFLGNQTPSMKRMYLMAIIDKIKDNKDTDTYEFYREMAREASVIDKFDRINRPMTEGEKANFIGWNQVIKLRDSRKERIGQSDYDHMMYVVLCLYTMLPPQRGQVYYNCYINRDVDGSNAIEIRDGRSMLVVRQHKTMRAYGEILLDINNELRDVLMQWYPRCIDGKLLSCGSSTAFTNLMYNIFGQKISTDMLRKIYVTENVRNGNLSIIEREALARKMGHSLSTQEFMYNKK